MATSTVGALREQIYERARGACECTRQKCGHHAGRCLNSLGYSWELQRIQADGPSMAVNLIALCEQCYHNTPDYWASKRW
jgi:hypothetical protein